MCTESNALTQKLRSADPAVVGVAVDELSHRLLSVATVPIPAPPANVPSVLRQAREADIDDRLVALLRVLSNYPFDPPIDQDDRVARFLECVLVGGSYVARALSLRLMASNDLVPTLERLGARGLRSAHEEEQAAWLVSYLLDDPASRSTTARIVRSWPADPALDRVVASIPEGLAAAERDLE